MTLKSVLLVELLFLIGVIQFTAISLLLYNQHWNKRLLRFSVFQLVWFFIFKEPCQNILPGYNHQLEFSFCIQQILDSANYQAEYGEMLPNSSLT